VYSGDGQVMTQHTGVPQFLVVQAVDARGIPVPDVEVSWSAAPGSAYVTPTTVRTDSNGAAKWGIYVHANGQQIVQATSPGLPSAFFTIAVTPTGHLYDGVYNCRHFLPDGTEASPTYLRIGIDAGVVRNASDDLINGRFYYSKSFDETTGSINVVQRSSLDFQKSFTGTMQVDANQRGSGSGTWVSLFHEQPQPGQEEGKWNCDRE